MFTIILDIIAIYLAMTVNLSTCIQVAKKSETVFHFLFLRVVSCVVVGTQERP